MQHSGEASAAPFPDHDACARAREDATVLIEAAVYASAAGAPHRITDALARMAGDALLRPLTARLESTATEARGLALDDAKAA